MKDRKRLRLVFILFFTILVGGCALVVGIQLDQQFGPASPQNRLTKTTDVPTVKVCAGCKTDS